MMQMLESGGMPLATDGIRRADEHNPRGYCELERVKSLQHPGSHTWIQELCGKAVKVPYVLLYRLPANCTCKIIFMSRCWNEICASQRLMLEASHVVIEEEIDATVASALRAGVAEVQEWLATQANIRVLSVDYNQLMRDARPQCKKINLFLTGKLDPDRMAMAVDSSLYRQRLKSEEEMPVRDEHVVWQRLKDLGYL